MIAMSSHGAIIGRQIGLLLAFLLEDWYGFAWYIIVFLISYFGLFYSIFYIVDKSFNAMTRYCDKHVAVSKRLILAFPESEGSTEFVVDQEAIWALLFFLGTVIVALLGYRFLYDSTGTIYPGWTTIFG
jgi:hypothetical protein